MRLLIFMCPEFPSDGWSRNGLDRLIQEWAPTKNLLRAYFLGHRVNTVFVYRSDTQTNGHGETQTRTGRLIQFVRLSNTMRHGQLVLASQSTRLSGVDSTMRPSQLAPISICHCRRRRRRHCWLGQLHRVGQLLGDAPCLKVVTAPRICRTPLISALNACRMKLLVWSRGGGEVRRCEGQRGSGSHWVDGAQTYVKCIQRRAINSLSVRQPRLTVKGWCEVSSSLQRHRHEHRCLTTPL